MIKRLFLVAAAFCFLSLGSPAQHRRIPSYPFARLDLNRIQYPSGKSPEFELFLRKLDTLATYSSGSVRILHVGGSHVQAGIWTQQLRRNLLSMRYGMDGGRGMVFPFNAAGTNTPAGYVSRSAGEWSYFRCLKDGGEPLGVTGMAVSTADTAAVVMIDMTEQNPREWAPGFTFKSVDILGHGTASPVVVLGRDTVEGVWNGWKYHFDLPHYSEYLQVRFRGMPGEFTLKGIYLDKPCGGLTVSECGVNGASTRSWLSCSEFGRDIELVRPDLVIFSIGINDTQGVSFDSERFIANYRELVREVRAVNPRCAILFTTNNDSCRHRSDPNPFGIDQQQAFWRLADSENAAIWDLFEIMGGMGSSSDWLAAGLMKSDLVHFTASGYDLLGDLLFNAIMDASRKRGR